MPPINGTDGPDTIYVAGSDEPDVFFSPRHNLIASATNGDDVISAGGGDDVILSGSGTDEIHGGGGNDIIGGETNSFGEVFADGAQLVDTDGDSGNGYAVVGGDSFFGDGGNDTFYAGYDTTVDGGDGRDTVVADLTGETVQGPGQGLQGADNDLGVDVNLQQAEGSGSVVLHIGGLGNLTITLKSVEAFNIVFGSGNDRVFGGDYNDRLIGDQYNFPAGNDEIHGGRGDDYIDGGGGADLLYGDNGDDVVMGGVTSPGFDDFASDEIHGGSGNDLIVGGLGDLFDGGPGNDVAIINISQTSFSYNINLDSIVSGKPYNLGDADPAAAYMKDGTRFNGIEHISDLELGDGNDVVVTSASSIEYIEEDAFATQGIYLGGGDDRLTVNGRLSTTTFQTVNGGSGNDTLILNGDYSAPFAIGFGTFSDFENIILVGGHSYTLTTQIYCSFTNLDASSLGAADTLNLTITEAPGGITVTGGAGDDVIVGQADVNFNDSFSGGGGNDRLTGGGGADTLTGGSGADTFVYLAFNDSTAKSYDTITDFESGTDKIDLSALGLTAKSKITVQLQSNGSEFLAIDANGDGSANCLILVDGALKGSDLVLGAAHPALGYAGTAAVLAADFDWINDDRAAKSIVITDGQPLTLSAADAKRDAHALQEISGAHTIVETGVVGQPYTTLRLSYDSSDVLSAKTFIGYTTTGYASRELDYNTSGALTKAIVAGYTGQPYTTLTLYYDSAMNVTSKAYSGYTTTGYTSQVFGYDTAGHLTSRAFYGYSDKPYTSEALGYDGAGHLLTKTFDGYTTTGYTTQTITLDAGGHTTSVLLSGYTGRGYTARQTDYNAAGQAAVRTDFNDDGSHSISTLISGSTITDTAAKEIIHLTSTDVLSISSFGTGNDTITGYVSGQNTIDIAKGVFANFSDLYAHAAADGHGTLVTLDANDTLLFAGVSLASFQNDSGDFHFI